jgi:hypothetical protein
MSTPSPPRRLSLGVAVSAGAVLVLGYVAFEIITAPPSSPAGSPAAASNGTSSGLGDVAEPTQSGFGIMTQSASDPAAVARAKALFNEALRRNPLDAGAWFGLGWADQVADDAATAERMYRVAVAVARTQPVATDIEYFCHYNLAWLYQTRGDTDAAGLELAYAQTVSANPQAAGVTAASTAAGRGLYDLGRVALRAAQQAQNGVAVAAYRRGLDAWHAGDAAAAEAAWRASLGPPPGAAEGTATP